MKQYLDLLRDVLNGEEKDDRTGTGTVGIFGVQMRFSLADGFPIVTTKKIHFKSVVHELLWFLKGSTNVQYLQDNGVRIWNEWADENGDLKKVYGYQWRTWPKPPDVEKIKRRDVRDDTFDPHLSIDSWRDYSLKGNSKKYGDFYYEICGNDSQGRPLVNLQYKTNNYIVENVRKDFALRGNVRNPYAITTAGVGYIGEGKLLTKLDKVIAKTWSHMLDRCYNPKCKEYKYYGERGVTICRRWMNRTNFIDDAKSLEGWTNKALNPSMYEIDKDYFGSNIYHPHVCSWILRKDNILYRNSRPFVARDPNGKESIEICISDYARTHDLQTSKISAVLKKQRKHHKKYSFNYLEVDDQFVYRYSRSIDQIKNAIDLIKNNPESRRIIVSAWNVAEIGDMALPPCHLLFQFNCRPININDRYHMYVEQTGKCVESSATDEAIAEECDHDNIPKFYLDCLLYQRSADLPIGVPFNITSYALLTHMMAQVTKCVAGEFIWTGGDVHIYKNQLSGVVTQLERDPLPLPKLELNPEVKDIDDFKYEDIKLVGYEYHPHIPMPVSI